AGRGPDRGGVPGRLPARGPERPPRRAAHLGDDRIHLRLPRTRRARSRRQRPLTADHPRGDRMSTEPDWGVDSEYGRLLDALLSPPDSFRWRETSAITRATLEAGHRFDQEAVVQQHADLVAAYEQAGVRCHFLETEPALPYAVFTRDSSTMGPRGAV